MTYYPRLSLLPRRVIITSMLVLFFVAGSFQTALAQSGVNPLTIFQNYFVTGDYVVAGWVQGPWDGSGFASGAVTIPDAMQPSQPGVPASVPTGADIVAAYLYWATVESSGTLAGQKAYFNGYPITGTMLGNQKTPATWNGAGCAGASNGSKILHSYRADVRPFLPLDTDPQSKTYGTKVANGTVRVLLADSGDDGGRVPIALGATLVVIYRSLAPSVPLNSIVLYDGDYAATNQSPNMSQTMIGFYQPATSPIAKMTHIVGNGRPTLNERVYLNNSAQPLPSIYGGRPPFPGIYGTWDNPTWKLGNYVKNTDTAETTSVVPAPTGCMAWGATILSTTVQDSDGDGLLDVWEQNQGYTDAVSKQWVPLPGANPSTKDLYVEVDWLSNLDGKAGAYKHSHLPTEAAIDAVGSAFLNESDHVKVHFDLGSGIYAGDPYVIPYPVPIPHPLPAGTLAPQAGAGGKGISESLDVCKDPALPGTPTTLCAFPNVPAVAWKGGFEYIKNTSTLGNFQPGRSKSYHYVLFGHALGTARSYWSALGTALVFRQTAQVAALVPQLISIVDIGSSAKVTIQSPAGLIKPGDCNLAPKPIACTTDLNTNRISISGALTQTALDGTYVFSNVSTKTVNNVSLTTFNITTKGVASGIYTYLAEPQLAMAYLGPVSASGQSDFGGGGDSAVTFGLWTYDDPKAPAPLCQPDPSQPLSGGGQAYCANQVGTITEQTGTLMHEIGHSLALTHGGTYFNDAANPSLPFRELNCKPNFLSAMNYLFQVRGFVDGGFDYSSQTLQPLSESQTTLNEAFGLGTDLVTGAPALHLTRFYAPQNAADKLSGNHASSHCDGSPLGPNDVAEVRVDAAVAPGGNYSAPLDFNHDNIVPDAILPLPAQQIDLNYNGSTTDAPFSGYNDWEGLNMQQIGSRQNAFGFSGGGVNFEGGGVNFEGGGVNFEGGGVDNDGGGVNFEGGGVNFEGGGVNFEGGGVNFEGGGIDQDLDTAASTADPVTGLTCTTAISTPVQYAPSGATACVLSGGTYTETGQAVPITWTAPGFGQTRVYTIYRACSVNCEGPANTFSAIATLTGAPPVTSYIDTGVDYGGTYTYYVTDTNLQGAVSGTSTSFTVSINKGVPIVVTWPTAGTITYGQQLQSSHLSGGSATIYDQGNVAVAGTFTFDSPTSMPHAGTGPQNVTFTPTDLVDYGVVHNTVSVTVNVATPTVTWPVASTITYGQQLNTSTFSNGSASNSLICCGQDTTVAGAFAFDSPTTMPGAGTAAQSVTFTPTDTQDYYSVTSTVNVMVNKATPKITVLPTASAITYGQQLSSSNLTGGGANNPLICCGQDTTVAGGFTFVTPATAPGAGTALQSVVFTPTDSLDYNTATNSVNVVVNMATPSVVWPTASTITYGQTLASSTLSGSSASYVLWSGSVAVPGTVAFTAPTTMPGAGTASQSVTFTPGDATDYNSVTSTVNVMVNKATPKISVLPTATTITYGQQLSSSSLTGGGAINPLICCGQDTTVAGTFAFITPTKAPGAGTALQAVIFTPTDLTDYNTAVGASILTGSVNVMVNKATPTVVWPTASTIKYGQALSSSTLTGDSASYVLWSGSVAVAGSVAFTAPTTMPGAGTGSQSVTFTPSDATDYSSVTSTVSIAVNKATPTISVLPTAGAIAYGQQLSSSSLTGGSAINPLICCGQDTTVAGTFAFITPTKAPGAGTALQAVIFTPTDLTDYNTAVGASILTGSVNVMVNKATPNVVWPTASTIKYGQTLASSTLTGGSASYVLWSGSVAVAGSVAFTAPTTMPGAGTGLQSVTFTPSDATNYSSVTSTVSVAVNKATPTIVTLPSAASITYGQTLSSSTLSGGSASYALSSGTVAVDGSFAFVTPTKAPGVGTALQSVIFVPTDSTDYNNATGASILTSSVSVQVNTATPTVTWPMVSQISCGQTLGSAILSGGSALNGVTPVGGTFTFLAAGTAPPVGMASWDMTFTPTDMTDYNLVQGTGVVSVNVIDPNPGTNDCP